MTTDNSTLRFASIAGSRPAAPEASLRAERRYRLALVLKNRVNPAYVGAMKAGEAAAQRYGIEVVNFVPETPDDLEQQSALLASVLRAGDFEGVVLTPVDAVRQVPLIEEANRAGLPVYNISNLLAGGEIVCFVGSDDVAIGRQVIEWVAAQSSGAATLALITGSPHTPTGRDRAQGVREALAQRPGLQLIAEARADFDRRLAREAAARLLSEHASFDWLVALNDEMALGALEAQDAAGARPGLRVTGVNGIPEALLALQQGRLAATADYALYEIAYKAIELAVRHLNGEALPQQKLFLPTRVIEPANVAEVIAQRRAWGLM